MTFFSHRPQIPNFPPIFSLFQHISFLFRENYYFPYFSKFPPLFYKNSLAFYILSVCFVSLPTLTMMHLCITQCTYWTPLRRRPIHDDALLHVYGYCLTLRNTSNSN